MNKSRLTTKKSLTISKTAAAAGTIGGGLGITVIGGAIYLASTGERENISDSPETLENSVDAGSSFETRGFQLNEIPTSEKTLEEIKNEISDWAKKNGNCKIKVRLTGETGFTEIEKVSDDTKKANLEKLYTVLSSSTGTNDDAKDKCTRAGDNRKMEVKQEASDSEWTFKIETLATIKEKITKWANSKCTLKIKPGSEASKKLEEFTKEEEKPHLISLHVDLIGSNSESFKNQCKDNATLEAKRSSNKWTLTQVNG